MSSTTLKTSYICPAKINIGLEVLYKRQDGYHELNTVFARVGSPCDVIEVSESAEFTLTCSDPSLATDESNLIFKAVKAFGAAAGKTELPRLHLHLNKQIPTGAGLGGGSSDAAQAIHICNDHFGQPLPLAELVEIGSWVGADVPFFVSGYKAAVAGGIGDRLEEFDMKHQYGLLIVKPESIAIPTAQAYAQLKVTKKQGSDIHDAISTHRWDMITNDFERVIFAANPQLADIKSSMQEQGAFFASMSGSGSAIYGLFDSKAHADKAEKAFSQQQLPHWVSLLG
ncbi:MAG TPA: 4-(cytidine 5'-diphospho)-2-C-methyl-D-erythritol kinase [Candidatus Kapabacteria bacterium]|nr:4-(cytidine 5'-diphospho)-2-C-methyl-D-erythritol kinase [Candidatus Kapabacteria bacterium]